MNESSEKNKKPTDINFAFFGTPSFATIILDELELAGFIPSLVVTQEDRPAGRGMELHPPDTKVWATSRDMTVFQPLTLKDDAALKALRALDKEKPFDLFIVASYGNIIPQKILDIPIHGVLNVHPSLLPKLRGSSPIVGAILEEEKTGVSIMLLDEKMDHGPILTQKEIPVIPWPPYAPQLENLLAHEGGKMLAEALIPWINITIVPIEQDHTNATFTKKVSKSDALINLEDSAELNLRKIRGYAGWPNAYTFFEHNGKQIRLIIKEAEIIHGVLILKKVIPEGRKEMSFEEFQRGFLKQTEA
jgi:methionyl-tRNA formyltransferase